MELDKEIMQYLFNIVWNKLLYPLFFQKNNILPISENSRKNKAFIRYMIGNLFILIKHKTSVDEIKYELRRLADNIDKHYDFDRINTIYQKELNILYNEKKIDMNNYHNSKNIVIMIPPNILKKDAY
jgi:hypothetical protein